jgi:hypothetical protein
MIAFLLHLVACTEEPCLGAGPTANDVLDLYCCEGLTARTGNPVIGTPQAPDLPEGCAWTTEFPEDTWACLPCGDGVCDPDLESYCNCPDDCPAPE